MIKKLHHSCDPLEIIADIKMQGLKVINVIPKLKRNTKEPLDMFLVSFEHTEDVNKIYNLKAIMNGIIKVEPVRKSNLIPQCKNCQSFEHTKNFCRRLPRCVKCAGDHSTTECRKPPEAKPKCCNCGLEHPASYRGCQVARKLQQKRNDVVKERRQVHEPHVTTNMVSSRTVTYAEAAKASGNEHLSSILNILSSLEKRLVDIEHKLCN